MPRRFLISQNAPRAEWLVEAHESQQRFRLVAEDNLFSRFAALEYVGRRRFQQMNNCWSYAVGNNSTLFNAQGRNYVEQVPPCVGDATQIPLGLLGYRPSVQAMLLEVVRLARGDGARFIPCKRNKELPQVGQDERLIALVVHYNPLTRGRDMHWYAHDDSGYWTHMTGHTAVPTGGDAKGQMIRDPRLAALPPQATRPCFFAVPRTGLDLRLQPETVLEAKALVQLMAQKKISAAESLIDLFARRAGQVSATTGKKLRAHLQAQLFS